MVALDASALIALFLREPGYERVLDRLNGACISSVNVIEVLSRLLRDGIDLASASRWVARLEIEQVPLGAADASEVAFLVARTRPAGLSLGDCVCLALANARGIPALTTDRAWAKLDLGIEIELIR